MIPHITNRYKKYMNSKNDLTNQKFGRLTAFFDIGKDKQRNRLWYCECICGGNTTTTSSRLKNGTCQSCGCILTENKRGRALSHGMSGANAVPEYNVWHSMKQRILNSKTKNYHRYGGRGLTLDKTWYKFESFYKDMGSRPSSKHSLDRQDNNKGYNKKNCRWVTQDIQANNTSTNTLITYNGKTQTLTQWAKQLNIRPGTLRQRLYVYNYSVKQALFGEIKEQENLLTYNSKTQNINDWAKELNIPPGTISGRLQMGWTIEETLSKPVKRAALKGVTKRGIYYQVRVAKNKKRITLYTGKDYFEACCRILSYRNA